MKSRNIKVVDEHNIDREANIIFGFDLDGSEYVTYWIVRDEESNNVFVSKVVKNLDNTFNLANIEDEFEKENVSKIVKDLIAKSVSDEADKLVGDSITLENGKVVKFISVSFNKEQRLDVKKTYITTVKKEVTKVSENYYDVVVSMDEPQLVSESSESVQEIPSQIIEPVVNNVQETPVLETVTPVIPEPVVIPEMSVVSEPVVTPEISTVEPVIDEVVSSSVEEKVPEVANNSLGFSTFESNGAVVEAITNESVLETPVVEKHEVPEVLPQPVQEDAKVILPQPVVQIPVAETVAPVIPEPAVVAEAPSVIEPIAVPVTETEPLVFNASKETNLNAALGEVASDATIPVENIEVVRDFGEETPTMSQTPLVPAQPAITPMVQPELSSEPKVLTKKAGFANSKFFMVIAVAFFLASCVFLGYEVFNYFQLTK